MQSVTTPSGASIPTFGVGTWHMGENSASRHAEVRAVKYALDSGIQLIDSAEMYAEGGAEEIVGQALAGRTDSVYIVSKVYPHNASRKGVIAACERSLRRLKRETIDLYLLHWPGSYPLAETIDGFMHLREQGKIADFGVSNFDFDDLNELAGIDQNLTATNQILYNLEDRNAEYAVIPWCRQRTIPVMAYCPLAQGGNLLANATVRQIALEKSLTSAQICLAWLLHQPAVIVIPKSSQTARIKENLAACEVELTTDEMLRLDQAFPGPEPGARLGMV